MLDEVHWAPEMFKVLRVLADRPGVPARFLLLGGAAPGLLRQASETLAGRIELIDVGGFSLAETGLKSAAKLWFRSGFPLYIHSEIR